jgi:hypothetical protein
LMNCSIIPNGCGGACLYMNCRNECEGVRVVER